MLFATGHRRPLAFGCPEARPVQGLPNGLQCGLPTQRLPSCHSGASMRFPWLVLVIAGTTVACGSSASTPTASPASTPTRAPSGRVVPDPKGDLARFVATYQSAVAQFKAIEPRVCADAAPQGECAQELLNVAVALDTSLESMGQTLWPTDAASADAVSLLTAVDAYSQDLSSPAQFALTNAQMRAKVATAESTDEPVVAAAITKLSNDLAGAPSS